jgi:hypothetical protein
MKKFYNILEQAVNFFSIKSKDKGYNNMSNIDSVNDGSLPLVFQCCPVFSPFSLIGRFSELVIFIHKYVLDILY